MRGFENLLKQVSTDFYDWFQNEDNYPFTITFYLVFSTYIPVVAQMSSLVFGYLRKKQDAAMSLAQRMQTGTREKNAYGTGASPEDDNSDVSSQYSNS